MYKNRRIETDSSSVNNKRRETANYKKGNHLFTEIATGERRETIRVIAA